MSATNKFGELEGDACPKCGDPIKPQWVACPGCGARLKDTSIKPAGCNAEAPTTCPGCLETVKIPQRKLRCPKCGHFVHTGCLKEKEFAIIQKARAGFLSHAEGKAQCAVCCPGCGTALGQRKWEPWNTESVEQVMREARRNAVTLGLDGSLMTGAEED